MKFGGKRFPIPRMEIVPVIRPNATTKNDLRFRRMTDRFGTLTAGHSESRPDCSERKPFPQLRRINIKVLKPRLPRASVRECATTYRKTLLRTELKVPERTLTTGTIDALRAGL